MTAMQVIDGLGQRYGKLPCELLALPIYDLCFCYEVAAKAEAMRPKA